MERNYKKEAERLSNAIRALASSPEALNNMECYLSIHFKEWLKKFAATPEDLSAELYAFSKIEF